MTREEARMPDALQGLKVLELGQLIAGPFAAKTLADFGADVIKIEPVDGGDPLRGWRLLRDGTSVWWEVQSRNKRSVALDLRQPDAQAAVRALAAQADVLVENFKPGTLEAWNLGWETLHALNPKLIMLRISGFGQTGPYRSKPGFGVLGEAMGGLRHLSAEPGRVPVRVGVSIGDTLAALHGVIGVLTALRHREVNGGIGQVVDVALYESVFNVMESLLPEYDAFGVVRGAAGSALPGIAPSNAYRCANDAYVLVAGNGDSIFRSARPRRRPRPGAQRRPRRTRRRDRRGDPGLDRDTCDRERDRNARTSRCAGGPHLHGRRHRRRPAVPGARHDRADPRRRRPPAQGARHRAQAERHAGAAAHERAAPGRAQRRGARPRRDRRDGARRNQGR
jgi:crotonobetainyl-CoA:carnitine CoA-transferase CaiB-like acyl-CoA transferase